jgi:hypothetical protein
MYWQNTSLSSFFKPHPPEFGVEVSCVFSGEESIDDGIVDGGDEFGQQHTQVFPD